MCGIIGIAGDGKELGKKLLKGIKKLEYRGYDSVGMAVLNEKGIEIRKNIGEVDKVDELEDFSALSGILGMAHSRWATCGGVTKENAHPHYSDDRNIAIVHNGIIENYEHIKKDLEKKGHVFRSETDSEVIAHYFEDQLKTKEIEEACRAFFRDIRGEFAVVMIIRGDDRLFALKRDSPLVLGLGKNTNILASDIYAFSDTTDKAIFFEDNEYAIVSDSSYEFYSSRGQKIQKKIQEFVWEQEESTLEEYDHYMIKEIMESPATVKRLLLNLKTEQKKPFEKLVDLIKKSKKTIFVASGTSYHAALLGVYYLHKCGVEAQTIIASEFEHFIGVDEESLVIAVSQSGETMDVIEALKHAKSKNAKIGSIVNVPYSTIQRKSDISLNIVAGQEICVAATKSFVNQVVLLLAIARHFGFKVNLDTLPQRITQVFSSTPKIKEIAESIADKKDIYILGRGLSYPVAREIALKIKEISYIHAEGMMGGELKHGTMALIEQGTPVIGLLSNKDHDMSSNLKEVAARGANVISIANELEGDIKINTSNDGKFAILAAIAGQLLTYYIAKKKGLPIDKPRNLAKSVTVK